MMSNNTASSPPPEVSCDAWSETEHTVEARVSPELLAMTRQRRKDKQESRDGDLFETGKTVEHRIPDDLLEMVRGRRSSREPHADTGPPPVTSAAAPSGSAVAEEASSSNPPVGRPPLEWNGPGESERMEISQVRVRPRTPPDSMIVEAEEQSDLSPALLFAVVAWAGLLAYCAFLGAGF